MPTQALLLRLAPVALRRGRRALSSAAGAAPPRSRRHGGLADLSLSEGTQMHGYRVQRVQPLPELDVVACSLVHLATGAQHLHLAADDSTNAFGVGFPTAPDDSTGVPHILEHCVLCGSERFPVHDPFFKMLNRSVASYMNAWTAADHTMYPFSTQNPIDFSNLLSVYLDAAFFPKLSPLDFAQEGHRLELAPAAADDSDPGVRFQGVVFNEMKGVLSDSRTLFHYRSQQALFPTTTYQHVSGGDPAAILDLTHAELVQFYKAHYHPSMARFFTYGDIPVETHLAQIAPVLERFERRPIATPGTAEVRWSEPRRVDGFYQASPSDGPDATQMSVSFLLGPITDPAAVLKWQVLSTLLISGTNSPMHKALIAPNIGRAYSANTGYSKSTFEASLSLGLEGIARDQVPAVEAIIMETLARVADEGFEQRSIDGIVHSIELGIKTRTSNMGLRYLSSLMGPWCHGGDVMAPLQPAYLDAFVADLADRGSELLQDMIRDHLLNNPHRLTYAMHPEDDYNDKLAAAEAARAAQVAATLTAADRQRIAQQADDLQALRAADEDTSCLPCLSIDDIPESVPYHVPHRVVHLAGDKRVPTYRFTENNNGIVATSTILTLPQVPAALRPYLPIYCAAVGRLATKTRSAETLAEDIRRFSSGISLSFGSTQAASDPALVEDSVAIGSRALDRNVGQMYSLLGDVLTETLFDDQEHLKSILAEHNAAHQNAKSQRGHTYAIGHSAAKLSAPHRLRKLHSGLDQANFVRDLAAAADIPALATRLDEVSQHVLGTAQLRSSVVTTSTIDTLDRDWGAFLDRLGPAGVADGAVAPYWAPGMPADVDLCPTYIALPINVHFAAQAFKSVGYTHDDSPKLTVLAALLNPQLHRLIREQGGAYGSGASAQAGVFAFYSYYDPHHLQTLDAFQTVINWAADGSFDASTVLEAKLSVFSGVDAPVDPAAAGQSLFEGGITLDMRQARRSRLLAVTRDDLVDVARRYLVDASGATAQTIVGPPNPTFEDRDGWHFVEG